MRDNGSGCGPIGTVVLIFIVIFCFMEVLPMMFSNSAGSPTAGDGQSIDMIQPQGFPQRDNQNSETNINNARAEELRAQAELLQAEARRLDTIAPAEAAQYYAMAEKLRAEACDIRNDCGLFNYLSGEERGYQEGRSDTLMMIVVGVVGFVLLVIIIGLLRR